jgi:putative flippase GtrA
LSWENISTNCGERKVGRVSFASGLYERFRHLIHEMAKFGLIGSIGFLITFAGTGLLDKKAGLGIVLGSTIATIVATFATYIGNRYWTFRHRERTGMTRETVLFFVLNGVGLVIQEAFVLFSKDVLGFRSTISDYTALLIGVVVATVFRFWSYRKWVWRASLAAAVQQEDDAAAGTLAAGREELEPATVRPAPFRSAPSPAAPFPQAPFPAAPFPAAPFPAAPFPHGPTGAAGSDGAGRSR